MVEKKKYYLKRKRKAGGAICSYLKDSVRINIIEENSKEPNGNSKYPEYQEKM